MSFKKLGYSDVLNKANSFRDIIESYKSITKQKENDCETFLRQNKIAPIIGVICDEGVSAEDAWKFPCFLAEKIHEKLTAKNIVKYGKANIKKNLKLFMKEKWASGIKDKRKMDYIKDIPNYIEKTCIHIINKYNNDPDKMFIKEIWKVSEIYFLLNELSGLGQKKISMVIRDFAEQRGAWYDGLKSRGTSIELSNLELTTVPVDYHVENVFKRMMGEYPTDSVIQFFGKLTYPAFPAKIDTIMWEIGKTYCKSKAECNKCPLKNVPCEYYLKYRA